MDMDALALEATGNKRVANGAVVPAPLPVQAQSKRKPAKKTKKAVVFFEVEILDAKTKDKLCFLDKVRHHSSFFTHLWNLFFFLNIYATLILLSHLTYFDTRSF